MIILKNKVEGYNNVLTIATNAMKFGVNTKVNYVAPKTVAKKPPIPPTTTTTTKPTAGHVEIENHSTPTKPTVANDHKKTSHLPYLFGSTIGIGLLVTKFVL